MNNTNSAGVLAVLDAAIASLGNQANESPNSKRAARRAELTQARAAVAELVEAAKVIDERIAYYASLKAEDVPNIEDWAYTDNSGDVAQFRAALAALAALAGNGKEGA